VNGPGERAPRRAATGSGAEGPHGGPVNEPDLARRAGAEALGTALLVTAVIGSGIAAQRLSPGDTGVQLLENAVATAAALVAIILTIGPVSGAHLNPAVTLVDVVLGRRPAREAPAYIGAQIAGGCVGAVIANTMFGLPLIGLSTQVRSGGPLWFSEIVATFGLVLVIFAMTRGGEHAHVPFAVAGYIAGAYWFTSSTSFANPAVTIGRTLSDTFAGIAPASAPGFVAAQLAGATLALAAVLLLLPAPRPERTFTGTPTAKEPA
jgi:glycerol uptake facilitator-like aquaporin